MRTVNDMIQKLQEHQIIVIPNGQQDIVPDLLFMLDVMCIPHRRRVVESVTKGQQIRIELLKKQENTAGA